jgi:hypothetical protein
VLEVEERRWRRKSGKEKYIWCLVRATVSTFDSTAPSHWLTHPEHKCALWINFYRYVRGTMHENLSDMLCCCRRRRVRATGREKTAETLGHDLAVTWSRNPSCRLQQAFPASGTPSADKPKV